MTTRIHNLYMLASAWKILGNMLRELIHRGMTSKNARALLKNDLRMRNLYLASVRMIELVVDINQQRFSVLALNSSMFSSEPTWFGPSLKNCQAIMRDTSRKFPPMTQPVNQRSSSTMASFGGLHYRFWTP